MADTEQVKTWTRRFVDEVFNNKNLDYADKSMADTFVEHSPRPGMRPDKAATIEWFRQLTEGTPDVRLEIQDIVASGDRVAIRRRLTGTDTSGFLPGMPPTQKAFSMEGIDILRWNDDGQVLEHRSIHDVVGAMRQLGLM